MRLFQEEPGWGRRGEEGETDENIKEGVIVVVGKKEKTKKDGRVEYVNKFDVCMSRHADIHTDRQNIYRLIGRYDR